jgi:hypothetical protein
MSGSMVMKGGEFAAREAAEFAAKKIASRAVLGFLGPVGAAIGVAMLAYDAYELYQMYNQSHSQASASEEGGCTGDCGNGNGKGKERKNEDGEVIVEEDRAEHILAGDKSGGGHRSGTGKPGKTEFPPEWTDDDILDGVSEVAQNGAVKGPAHRPGEVVKTGTINGVDIDVVVKGDGKVRTGYPTGGPGVIQNPR